MLVFLSWRSPEQWMDVWPICLDSHFSYPVWCQLSTSQPLMFSFQLNVDRFLGSDFYILRIFSLHDGPRNSFFILVCLSGGRFYTVILNNINCFPIVDKKLLYMTYNIFVAPVYFFQLFLLQKNLIIIFKLFPSILSVVNSHCWWQSCIELLWTLN